MEPLSPAHRRYLVIETAISTVANTVVGVLFAFLAAGGRPEVPLWGGVKGIAFDLLPTTFMITLVTALVVTFTARKRLGGGKVEALQPGEGGLVSQLPEHVFLRALACAAGCALVVVPLSIGTLAGMNVDSMPTPGFILFKAAFSAGLSILVTPAIARAALCPKARYVQATSALHS